MSLIPVVSMTIMLIIVLGSWFVGEIEKDFDSDDRILHAVVLALLVIFIMLAHRGVIPL